MKPADFKAKAPSSFIEQPMNDQTSTFAPSEMPGKVPIALVGQEKINNPTTNPTPEPTEMPTVVPNMLSEEDETHINPTPDPTEIPTAVPSMLSKKEDNHQGPTDGPTEMPTTVPGVVAEKDERSNKPTFAPTELPTTVPSWYIEQEEKDAKSASSPTDVPSRISRASSGGRDIMSNMGNLAADVALPDQIEAAKPGYISFLGEMQKYGASLLGARCFSMGLYWSLGFMVTASMVLLSRQNKDGVPVECKVVSLTSTVIQAPDSKGILSSGDTTGSAQVKTML